MLERFMTPALQNELDNLSEEERDILITVLKTLIVYWPEDPWTPFDIGFKDFPPRLTPMAIDWAINKLAKLRIIQSL